MTAVCLRDRVAALRAFTTCVCSQNYLCRSLRQAQDIAHEENGKGSQEKNLNCLYGRIFQSFLVFYGRPIVFLYLTILIFYTTLSSYLKMRK